MTIPDFQTIMLPLLESASDGQEHTTQQTISTLADHFHLKPEERQALLPSGNRIFNHRTHWAITHMKSARLLESVRWGVFRITPRGQQVLAQHPPKINRHLLMAFPEYVAFIQPQGHAHPIEGTPAAPTIEPASETTQTPIEQITSAFQQVRKDLASEVLEQVMASSPGFFERLVVDLLLAMGYGGSREDAGQTIGNTGDGGVDGIIKEDQLGLNVLYIQAKRWKNKVGSPEIHAFVGALNGKHAHKGVFITTSDFTADAREFTKHLEASIVLVNGAQLAQLMIDHNVGVATTQVYELKRIDSDYFAEE